MGEIQKLKRIFKDIVKLDFDNMSESHLDKHLLSQCFDLRPRDLVYLLYAIEKEFGITIPQEAIAEGKFSSFNNIYSIITSQEGHKVI